MADEMERTEQAAMEATVANIKGALSFARQGNPGAWAHHVTNLLELLVKYRKVPTATELVGKVAAPTPLPPRPDLYALAYVGSDGEWTLGYSGYPRAVVEQRQAVCPGSQIVVIPGELPSTDEES